MRRRPTRITPTKSPFVNFFDKAVAIIKVIRIELLIAAITLILALGQYFQNSINVRINITKTWKEGYTSETRDRVTRFNSFWSDWKQTKCEEDPECQTDLRETISIFTSPKLFKGELNLAKNKFIIELTKNEIDAIGRSNRDLQKNPITEEEYVEIVLKYRNAIIECLNTMEAVKAVIEAKPLPFRIPIFYKDTLEGRYRDIIKELTIKLDDFIVSYREVYSQRETEAWHVLTSEESSLNDIVNVAFYFLIFALSLTLIYFVKMQMQKLGIAKQE